MVRRCQDKRLDSERRAQKPMLPPPDIDKTDESRERVRRMMQDQAAKLAEKMRSDDAKSAADAKRKAEFDRRLDERFRPDMDARATAQRLGFDVGDPDGGRGVA